MARYRVVGPMTVHGHDPGTEFERDLPPEQAAALVAGGHLEVLPDPAPDPPKPKVKKPRRPPRPKPEPEDEPRPDAGLSAVTDPAPDAADQKKEEAAADG